MNESAMLSVADVVEYYADRFDIGNWAGLKDDAHDAVEPGTLWEDCGTSGCIAGWTCAWADSRLAKDDRGRIDYAAYPAKARKELGLTAKQAERLFYPDSDFWTKTVGENYGLKIQTHQWAWGTVDRELEDPTQLTGELAATVLRDIVAGKIKL